MIDKNIKIILIILIGLFVIVMIMVQNQKEIIYPEKELNIYKEECLNNSNWIPFSSNKIISDKTYYCYGKDINFKTGDKSYWNYHKNKCSRAYVINNPYIVTITNGKQLITKEECNLIEIEEGKFLKYLFGDIIKLNLELNKTELWNWIEDNCEEKENNYKCEDYFVEWKNIDV